MEILLQFSEIYATVSIRCLNSLAQKITASLHAQKIAEQIARKIPCLNGSLQHTSASVNYSQSSPCDHSRKRPALVRASIVKPCLTCHLNSVMKSSHKRPLP